MRHNLLAIAAAALSSVLAFADPPDVPPPGTGAPRPPVAPGGPYGGPAGFGPQATSQQFKDLIPSLVEALKDSDAEVRQHSAMALAELGHEAIKPLTEAISDPSKDKRAAAAYALGQMGYEGREAIPALLKALKDEESVVRRSSSQALSRILSKESMMYGRGFGMPGMAPGRPYGGFGGPAGAVPSTPPPLPVNPPKSTNPEKSK